MMRFFIALFICIAFAPQAFAAPEVGTTKVLNIQTLKTKSGIEAWLVEDKSVPVISISFSFDGGLIYDPEDKPGVGRLVSILLDEGAGELQSQEFQKQLSNNAISMSFTSGRDAFYGRLKTLKSNKNKAFDLLEQALTKPRFDSEAVERMRAANISDINDDMGSPAWLVARIFNGSLFEGHYYAEPGFGNLSSMSLITRQDLIDFTKAQFARNVLKVSIAGDISKADAQDAIEQIFGNLPEKAEEVEAKDITLAHPGKTIMLPLDTPQTFITVGQKGIRRSDPTWYAASIMNFILGGGDFDARLMKEVREKRGLTYGIYSSLTSMKYTSMVQATLSTSNDKAEEALKVLKEEWAKMAKTGPTETELRNAKAYLTGSLLLELTSTGDIAETMNSIQRDDLGVDYINQYTSLMNAVTLDDVQKAAQTILKPEELTTVMVGQPKNINVDILLDTPPGMDEIVEKK